MCTVASCRIRRSNVSSLHTTADATTATMADRFSDLLDQVRAAIDRGRPLCIRGSGSKDWYGEAPEGEPLDTRIHSGIVDYDPSELVITARCGTLLAELEATLAASGQMLACEPPHFGPGATVGGCVATGLSGPRRASAGSVRDFVLGARLINGRSQHLSFGGRVIKNVAGYDVSRLLAGSLGILGVITEVSLKVVPMPVAEATLLFESIDQADAIERLNRWAGQPLPVSASAWHRGRLHVRLSGARAAVEAAQVGLGGTPLDAASASGFWRSLREQADPYFAGTGALWRLSLPSTAPVIDLPGQPRLDTLIEWGGALRWLVTGAAPQVVRDAARSAGGHATLFRPAAGQPRSAPCFAPLDPAIARIHRRLKDEFDPAGIFNRGRLLPGL
jgi:glycolate oxidase FAD binding subunit